MTFFRNSRDYKLELVSQISGRRTGVNILLYNDDPLYWRIHASRGPISFKGNVLEQLMEKTRSLLQIYTILQIHVSSKSEGSELNCVEYWNKLGSQL